MRVLIAEDETIIRLDLRALLERAGFEVCAEARDGEEAVELARETEPEVAVLARLYIARCERLIADPPGDGWTPAEHFKTK